MSFSNTSTVPIHMLPGIGSRTAKVLQSLGILTVGQFKQLPENLLVELFGPSIRNVHKYVRGTMLSGRLKKGEQFNANFRKARKAGLVRKMQMFNQLLTVL